MTTNASQNGLSQHTIQAAGFINSLGVGMHIAYTDGGYASLSNDSADLAYLGLNNVRDGVSDGENGSAPLSSYITLAQQGIKFTCVVAGGGALTTASLQAELGLYDQINKAVPGSIVAVEGSNEINNAPITFNGVGGLQGALDLQRALYAAVHADTNLAGVAVDYFTGYNAGSVAVGPDPTATAGLADYDTQHPYPNNGDAPAAWVTPSQSLGNESASTGYGPAVFTETGYSTNGGTTGGVNADVQAKYTLDLLLDDAANGISRTYLYQLMDAYKPGSPQGDDGFGLFDPSNAPKAAATAIHNLVGILADKAVTAATFTPATLGYSVTGLPSTGNSLALEKADGTYDIAVWNEPKIWNEATGTETTAATQNVTVQLGGTYATVEVFDPLASAAAVSVLHNVSSIQLGLTDHPLLVQIEPTAPVVAVPAPAKQALVTYNWNPATQLGDYLAAEAKVAAGTVGARAKIVAIGDSTTAGIGDNASHQNYRQTLSYPAELAQYLAQNGVPAQYDNFVGGGLSVDGRITLLGGGSWSGTSDAGGQVITTSAAGDGFDFTLLSPVAYDRVDVNYIDYGSGTATVAVDGQAVATFQIGNSGLTKTQTINLPLGLHSDVSVTANDANRLFIEGTAFWNTAAPKVEVVNAGKGGGDSGVVNQGSSSTVAGSGEIQGAAELAPQIVLINYGINDINNGTETTAQTVANLALMVTELRSVNADPIIVIPQPFSSTVYATQLPALRAALHTLSDAVNVPLIDLSATYNDDFASLSAAGLMSDNLHPSAALYADIGSKIAALLASATGTTPVTPPVVPPATPPVTPPVTPPATPPVIPSVTIGTGPDSLVLQISEDAYKGNAQFTVSVDGKQIGGTQTALASHAAGADQTFTVEGSFGVNQHSVGVNFLNDAYGGTPQTDRNLYVDAASYDGTTAAPGILKLFRGGMQFLKVGTAAPAAPVFATLKAGSGPDVVALKVSEDAYKGDAQFTVSVDGTQVGGAFTTTALHAAGQSQEVDLSGTWGKGAHTVTVNFLNDLYDGTASTDRNLYVAGASYDGVAQTGAALSLMGSGPRSFGVAS